ncbi:hypothetical protein AAFP30_28500 [Gordonia sp. CPCC 205515]|uniref:hypothetical protein n=1 Tax=Gordonia sp. CPCC 205515 TaxID=3140791 RepID=UPI003AF33937
MTMGGREAGGDKIQWTRLDQPWYDRIVETLLLRKFRGIAKVEAIDGRGGDGGMDVGVTYPDGRLVIYQLKYYPEGMSGGWKPRRTEVKKSFKQAVNNHEPHEWVLVTPRNHTNSEKRFVRSLPDETPHGKRRPTSDRIGRAELDQMLIDYPEVDRWLTLDHVRHTREIFERERRAFLDSPATDLAKRISDLGELIDSTDPDWTWDFARHENMSVQALRPLHDNAAERSPIAITFGTSLDSNSSVGRAFRRSIEYGTPTQVVIPGTALTRFEISGPPIVSGLTNPQHLVVTSLPIESSPAVGMLMEIRFRADGEIVATQEGTTTEVHHGTRGITSVMSFHGGRLTVNAEIPYTESSGATTMTVGYDPHGLSPRAVAQLLETVLRLHVEQEAEFLLDGRLLTKYSRPAQEIDDNEFKEVALIWNFADDLAKVLDHSRQNMTFPDSFSVDDRVHARVARQLISGHIVASPLAQGVIGHIPEDSPINEDVRKILTTRQYRLCPAGRYVAPIAGRDFDLGEAIAVHPETWVENGSNIVEALERHENSGRHFVLRPGDDPYFFIYLADTAPHDYADRWFVGWNLDGIDEPWLDRPWLATEENQSA